MRKSAIYSILICLLTAAIGIDVSASRKVSAERLYLSGTGCDDMVDWDFYCTGGRNAGKWSRIGVPSCWELQGFGTYQYGYEYNKWNKKPSTAPIADEHGIYRYKFILPKEWKGRTIEIVFEAAMTDTEVRINGKSVGEVHQGGFSPFRYDISDKVSFGKKENILEVEVCKESSDADMNLAERRCDYWNFGGIIRPVYLESRPKTSIVRTAIDANMDGVFIADCFLSSPSDKNFLFTEIKDKNGNLLAGNFTSARSDSIRISIDCGNPELWTAETPNLYVAEFSLRDKKGNILYENKERFGFRTAELRKGEGFFINGKKVRMKGVNRHSFRPESGRTLSRTKNLEDALLIKSMNMNAVRLSHYPADPEFYEICDSIGLYVIDELTGWQHPQKTEIGRKLVKELVTRDVNHPSVIIWASGNEGGFNYNLEDDFRKHDIQNRPIIYPWSIHEGLNTRHYRSWNEMKKYLQGPDVVMPTEFLHGLYDGGLGAGLYDYWSLMKKSDYSAGGFLWALYDEGVVRTDMDGVVDTKECFGPDGIMGPHGEREASYYTIKQIWSPVQIEMPAPDKIVMVNCYDFRNLSSCQLFYRYLKFPMPGDKSEEICLLNETVRCPEAGPGESAHLSIKPAPENADGIELTIYDSDGMDLFTWRFPIERSVARKIPGYAVVSKSESGDTIRIVSCGKTYMFSKSDGSLIGVDTGRNYLNFSGGPRIIAARRSDRTADGKGKIDKKTALATTTYVTADDNSVLSSIQVTDSSLNLAYSGGILKRATWKFMADGSARLDCLYDFDGVVDLLGICFDYPESLVNGKRWVGDGPYRVWQNRLHGPQHGYWETAYNDPIPGKSFQYPEFKGYFANIEWLEINTSEGDILMTDLPKDHYAGIFTPRDGSDNYLYDLPETGISILRHIPAVRNKVDYSDLNGPSAQPHLIDGAVTCGVTFIFR